MIFVTVGMHYQAFDRLIHKMDEFACETDEKIIMQIGVSNYIPKHAEFFRFIDEDTEIARLIEEARLVVSHAGAGTILMGLRAKKIMIVVPRLQKYGEHVDDQQLDLARILSESRRIIPVYDIAHLGEILRAEIEIDATSSSNGRLQEYVRNIIGCMDGNIQRS